MYSWNNVSRAYFCSFSLRSSYVNFILSKLLFSCTPSISFFSTFVKPLNLFPLLKFDLKFRVGWKDKRVRRSNSCIRDLIGRRDRNFCMMDKAAFYPSSSLSEHWVEWYWVGVSMTKIKDLSHFTFGLVEIAFPPLGGGTSWVMLAVTERTVRNDLSVLKTEFFYRSECCNTLFLHCKGFSLILAKQNPFTFLVLL